MAVAVVNVEEVRQSGYRISKVGTSGFDSLPDAIAKLNECQLDALNLLTPHYGKVDAVDDILSPFIKEGTATFTSGVLTLPSDYYGFVSAWKTIGGNTVDVRKIKTNEIGSLAQNTIRRGTVANPKIYVRNGSLVINPSNGDAGITMIYIRKPVDVSITTTPVEDADDDYETVTAQTNFEWPWRAKNLLIYLFVERLGVEMKQPILFEIAQLGIKMNMVVEKPGK